MSIARRSRRIAVQSAAAGMGMSLAAMAVAAVGLLPPAVGALLQEAIDLAVIGNALRALREGRDDGLHLPDATRSLLRRFAVEHDELRDALALLLESADRLAAGTTRRDPARVAPGRPPPDRPDPARTSRPRKRSSTPRWPRRSAPRPRRR